MPHSSVRLALIARCGSHLPFIAAGFRETAVSRPQTPFGTSNPIHLMEGEGLSFALVSRHGEQGYEIAAPWVNDRANLYALKDLGVERIVSWSSPGSLDPAIAAGDLVIPDDVLDETRAPPYSFFEGKGIGVIRMNDPFCPSLRARFGRALAAAGIAFRDGGVYAGVQGPRLETPAESAKLRAFGATLVGMTVVPEVFRARELEICYAAVCLVVNQAEGVRPRPYVPGVLFEGLAGKEETNRVAANEAQFPRIAAALLRAAAGESAPPCHCRRALERYRIRGDIGSDWRRWWD